MSRRHLALAAALLAVATTPVAAQENGWAYRATPDPVELTYLAPGDLAPSVSLSCVKDSRQLMARFSTAPKRGVEKVGERWLDDVGRPAPWPVSVTLASSAAQTTIPGQVEMAPDGQASIISVEFADRAPVAEAFRQTGVLSLAALGQVLTPAPAPRRSVQSFLRYCR